MNYPNNLINSSTEKLSLKLQKLNIQELNISEYNKNYLTKYKNNFGFYMSIYTQLFTKILVKLEKPVSEYTFVDYGGGCGIFSYLAKNMGFKTVVYNDLFETSVEDVKVISEKIGISVDYLICGDIDHLLQKMDSLQLEANLICSFDVLEHIYNIENWITRLSEIKNDFSLFFMTSANPGNPFINNRLKKLQVNAEFNGFNTGVGWKKTDLSTSFLEERKKIIKNKFPSLDQQQLQLLAKKTRGQRKEDILKTVESYIETTQINYKINHPTNTCDPYTGNWTEKLLDLKSLKKFIRNKNLEVAISNSFYAYSNNKILNIPKFLSNLFIKSFGKSNLFFSPTYTLEIHKTRNFKKRN